MHFSLFAKLAVVAASALDAGSSYGKPELNPVLAQHGQFTVGSIGIKAGIVGGFMLAEWAIERKHPKVAQPIAIGNIGAAAALTGVAMRNFRTK